MSVNDPVYPTEPLKINLNKAQQMSCCASLPMHDVNAMVSCLIHLNLVYEFLWVYMR